MQPVSRVERLEWQIDIHFIPPPPNPQINIWTLILMLLINFPEIFTVLVVIVVIDKVGL